MKEERCRDAPSSAERLVLAVVADGEVGEVAAGLLDEGSDDGLIVCGTVLGISGCFLSAVRKGDAQKPTRRTSRRSSTL
jgi:hypothetical protein